MVAVYVDVAIWKWTCHRFCQLLANDTDQLQRFAAHLGLKRSSYQEGVWFPEKSV